MCGDKRLPFMQIEVEDGCEATMICFSISDMEKVCKNYIRLPMLKREAARDTVICGDLDF